MRLVICCRRPNFCCIALVNASLGLFRGNLRRFSLLGRYVAWHGLDDFVVASFGFCRTFHVPFNEQLYGCPRTIATDWLA